MERVWYLWWPLTKASPHFFACVAYLVMLSMYRVYSVNGRWMMMNVVQRWNDNWGGKTEVLRQKSIPVSFSPLLIPHGLPWNESQAIIVKSCLIHLLLTIQTPLSTSPSIIRKVYVLYVAFWIQLVCTLMNRLALSSG